MQDNGGTANGGIDLDPVAEHDDVHVTAVNDAPVGSRQRVINAEETRPTSSRAADFGFTDPNDSPANSLQAVKITTLPATAR